MRIWHYFLGTATELLSLMVCLVLYPFKSSRLDVPNAKEQKRLDVLCVHGYLHNETLWIWFKRQLKKGGVASVNTVCYRSIRDDILSGSLKVKERIEQFKNETGREIDILIGHSEGGLVCLEYALEHAPKDRMTYIVSLGSPLHGTKMAKFGFGPGVKQMEIDSPYLQRLRERLFKAEHIRLLTLATREDFVIIPWQSSLLTNWKYAEYDVFDGLGHVAFLFSPRVVKRILVFISGR